MFFSRTLSWSQTIIEESENVLFLLQDSIWKHSSQMKWKNDIFLGPLSASTVL